MKDSELLRYAKVILTEEDDSYFLGICYAIKSASHSSQSSQVESLIRWVLSMLDVSLYLGKWLFEKGHITKREFELLLSDDEDALAKLKATRLAWLDWMIAECEKAEAEK